MKDCVTHGGDVGAIWRIWAALWTPCEQLFGTFRTKKVKDERMVPFGGTNEVHRS